MSNNLMNEVSDIKAVVETQSTQIEELRHESDRMKVKLASYKDEMEAVENYSRRNCLLFPGLKEDEEEDTDTSVIKIIKDNLNLDIELSSIERSHRLGKPKAIQTRATHPRPVIVKFVSYRERA